VTRFEILSGVAARQDDWSADLSRQQQHLLAILVMAGGMVVGRGRLEEVLWDFSTPYPEHGVERVASELRRKLRRTSSDDDPVPARDGGYLLPVTQEQADVLRFRAACAEARRSEGAEGLELMARALQEWGPRATGLYGGRPLGVLQGQWADSTRHALRTEYRNALIHYLTQSMSNHNYTLVFDECEQRATNDLQALRDEEFIELWMRAACHAGHPARAHQIYRQAADTAARAGERVGISLTRLDALLRADGRRPGVSLTTGPQKSVPVLSDQGSLGEQEKNEDMGRQRATLRGTIHADKVSGYAAAVRTDLATGHIEGDIRVGSVDAGGEIIGVDHRQRR
jgi:DNA-binding SARP family transcriptional activator